MVKISRLIIMIDIIVRLYRSHWLLAFKNLTNDLRWKYAQLATVFEMMLKEKDNYSSKELLEIFKGLENIFYKLMKKD